MLCKIKNFVLLSGNSDAAVCWLWCVTDSLVSVTVAEITPDDKQLFQQLLRCLIETVQHLSSLVVNIKYLSCLFVRWAGGYIKINLSSHLTFKIQVTDFCDISAHCCIWKAWIRLSCYCRYSPIQFIFGLHSIVWPLGLTTVFILVWTEFFFTRISIDYIPDWEL